MKLQEAEILKLLPAWMSTFRINVCSSQCFFQTNTPSQLKSLTENHLIIHPSILHHKSIDALIRNLLCCDFMQKLISVGFAPGIDFVFSIPNPVDHMY